MKKLNSIFLRGLITLLPIVITIYLMLWCMLLIEDLLGSVLQAVLPPAFYIRGLGIAATILIIFLFGLLVNNFIIGSLITQVQEKLTKVPFIKAIYSPLRDLINLFSQKSKGQMKAVVLVPLSENGPRVLGIVTRENFSDLPRDLQMPDCVTVYLPYSYALGGFTVLVKRDQLQLVDIPIERAMSLAITGWVKAESSNALTPPPQ